MIELYVNVPSVMGDADGFNDAMASFKGDIVGKYPDKEVHIIVKAVRKYKL